MSPDAPASAEAIDGTSIKRAAVRGSIITVASYAASTVVRVGANLVVTRLLVPEQFGLMALVNVFLIGLQLFSDIGVGPNVIQSRRGEEPVFLNTAWTIQVIRGLMLWGVAAAIAWPLARFYHHPQLLALLPVAGIAAAIGGLESTRLFTQNRRLAMGRLAALELATQAVGVTVMIAAAWATRSVWALVASALCASAAKTLLSHTLLPGERNRPAWDPEARAAIFDFGRWIVLSTAVMFLASRSDQLILAKLVTAEQLGLYAIAVNLAGMPYQIIGQLANRIFYPVVAQSVRRGPEETAAIWRSRTRLLVVMAPLVAMGVALAPPVVSLVYPPAYHAVGPLTSLLAIGTWIASLSSTYSSVVMAGGTPKYMSLGNVAKTVLFVGLVWLVSPRFGVAGVALLVSLSELALLAAGMIGSARVGLVAWRADLAITACGAGYVWLCRAGYQLGLRVTGGERVAAVAAVFVATCALTAGLARKVELL
jgi:O-antigen/teichoic acid export membrane protein